MQYPQALWYRLSFSFSVTVRLGPPPGLLLILNEVLMEHSLFTQHRPYLCLDTQMPRLKASGPQRPQNQ